MSTHLNSTGLFPQLPAKVVAATNLVQRGNIGCETQVRERLAGLVTMATLVAKSRAGNNLALLIAEMLVWDVPP